MTCGSNIPTWWGRLRKRWSYIMPPFSSVMAFLDDSRLSLTPWSFRTRVSFLSAQLRHKILVKKQSLEISFPAGSIVVNFRLKSLLETTFAQRKQICSFDDGDTHTCSIDLVGVESGQSRTRKWNLKPQMRVTPPPIFGAKCKWKPCKRDKSSRDFVARGRPLRGQKRLAPLAKRSTCGKSDSITKPRTLLKRKLVWKLFFSCSNAS